MDVIGDSTVHLVKWPAPEFHNVVKSLPPISWNTPSHQNNLIHVTIFHIYYITVKIIMTY